MTRFGLALAASLVLAAAVHGCGDDSGDPGSATDADAGGGMDASTAPDGSVDPRDGGELTECTNGVDDDGDGDVDGLDVECTGPTDDDEGSFATGIPGDNRDPFCQDCFFDGNSGPGNDGCRYATSCLSDGDPSSGSGSCMTCDPSESCLAGGCLEATPNGCDCFGCCEVQLEEGGSVKILLGGACGLENIEDTTACPRCVQSDTCINDCGRCELCLGRSVEDLPSDCFPDGGVPTWECDPGQTPCPDGACPAGFYCQLGCCLSQLI